MANFATYELGQDNVYRLSDGLLPEVASVFDVPLGDEPNADTLGRLVGAIGKSKVLQENITSVQETLGTEEDGLTIAADWIKRSGVQEPLDRSLWTPDQQSPQENGLYIMTGSVANWADRTAELLEARPPGMVYLVAGNRTMDTPTERNNPHVKLLQEQNRRQAPTEQGYMKEIIAPRLKDEGHDVTIVSYETKNGQEIAQRFTEEHKKLLSGQLTFARVANAGIQLAVQFRQAARDIRPQFDANRDTPQAFVLTDGFRIAHTPAEVAQPTEYQNPQTALRQVALTGKMLVEAARR